MGSPGAGAGSSPRPSRPRRGRSAALRGRSTLALASLLGVALLTAGAAATSTTAAAATTRAALLPPKPGLGVSGGGGGDDGGSSQSGAGGSLPLSPKLAVSGGGEGGEGGSEGNASGSAAPAALPAPAAWVQRLQADLARLGYFNGPDTGVYGPLTTAAVMRFQAADGLASDGRWGPASQAMLMSRLGARTTIATASSTSSAALPPPAAWVQRLQTDLARLGYFNGPRTGVYGPLTTAAVKRFQAAGGLTSDGRWGPASQAALKRRLATRG